MSVDVGMDIIATKNNKLISVQVKTANLSAFNVYNFDVEKFLLKGTILEVFFIFLC